MSCEGFQTARTTNYTKEVTNIIEDNMSVQMDECPAEDMHAPVSGRFTKIELITRRGWVPEPKSGQLMRQTVSITRRSGYVKVKSAYAPQPDGITEGRALDCDGNEVSLITFRIGKDRAEHVFSLLDAFFSGRHDAIPMEYDASMWSVMLTESGEACTYESLAGPSLAANGEDLSDVMRHELGMPFLWAFGSNSNGIAAL